MEKQKTIIIAKPIGEVVVNYGQIKNLNQLFASVSILADINGVERRFEANRFGKIQCYSLLDNRNVNLDEFAEFGITIDFSEVKQILLDSIIFLKAQEDENQLKKAKENYDKFFIKSNIVREILQKNGFVVTIRDYNVEKLNHYQAIVDLDATKNGIVVKVRDEWNEKIIVHCENFLHKTRVISKVAKLVEEAYEKITAQNIHKNAQKDSQQQIADFLQTSLGFPVTIEKGWHHYDANRPNRGGYETTSYKVQLVKAQVSIYPGQGVIPSLKKWRISGLPETDIETLKIVLDLFNK